MLVRSCFVGLLGILGFAACGSAPAATADAGVADAAIEVCLEPDRTCPAAEPFPGSPCEGMLHCEYAGGIGSCVAGAWTWETLCDVDGGCAPPLVESCRDPFAGALTGASVAIGPDEPGAFRPFSTGEHVSADFGSQGGAMLAYRLRIDGPAGTPTCVTATATLAYDTMAPFAVPSTVEVHCGQTLRIYAVMPDRPCEARGYPVTLDVEVGGVGSARASLVIDGGLCPR